MYTQCSTHPYIYIFIIWDLTWNPHCKSQNMFVTTSVTTRHTQSEQWQSEQESYNWILKSSHHIGASMSLCGKILLLLHTHTHTNTQERFPLVSTWVLGKREWHICPADFHCFFSEPVFHPSPHPFLCSSEKHQELVHGNVREGSNIKKQTADDCTTSLLVWLIKITIIFFLSKFSIWIFNQGKEREKRN